MGYEKNNRSLLRHNLRGSTLNKVVREMLAQKTIAR